MAKTCWCARCDGGGSVPCTVCAGYGYYYPAPSGADLDPLCRMCVACNGSGEVTCQVCHGSGRVEI